MTRTVFYSETNDSSLVLNKLENGLFRMQLDNNFVDLTLDDLRKMNLEIYEAEGAEICK
jgi:hypothetical protein